MFRKVVLSFSLTPGTFNYLFYFINDPLFIEQCIVQLPIVCMFSTVVFVVWKLFHGLLRRMYIVQKLDEIFYGHQLSLFDVWCDLVLEFLY
jgi:hypothetical protein